LPDEPTPLGDALRAVRRQLGTPAPSVFERVRAAWPELVGTALADHSRPMHLRAGVLRVYVDDPAWGGQFRYLADTLVTALAERVPEAGIREVSVTGRAPGPGAGAGPGAAGSGTVDEWSDGGAEPA
jgi:predicted nucleic acid-binding Zn ribbon protein